MLSKLFGLLSNQASHQATIVTLEEKLKRTRNWNCDEIENTSLIHRNSETYVYREFQVHVVQNSKWGRPTNWFSYFIYDLRFGESSYEASKLLNDGTCNGRDAAKKAAQLWIDWHLMVSGKI